MEQLNLEKAVSFGEGLYMLVREEEIHLVEANAYVEYDEGIGYVVFQNPVEHLIVGTRGPRLQNTNLGSDTYQLREGDKLFSLNPRDDRPYVNKQIADSFGIHIYKVVSDKTLETYLNRFF